MHNEIKDLFSLQNKTALITGGASVLGYEAAGILAAAGCRIAITSRQLTKAQQAAEKIAAQYNVDTIGIEMDHTRPESVTAAGERYQQWSPRLDILINNAGGGSGSNIAQLFQRDTLDIHNSIQTNLTGVVYCCKVFGAFMEKQGAGKIINIASIAGLIGRDRRMYEKAGMPGQPVDYAAAKAGVIGLTKDLAGFLSPKGIHVNAISPGGFTSESRGHSDVFVKAYSNRTPLGRMGRDGIDLKGVILFLASPASDYITGQNIVVDGGFSSWQ